MHGSCDGGRKTAPPLPNAPLNITAYQASEGKAGQKNEAKLRLLGGWMKDCDTEAERERHGER